MTATANAAAVKAALTITGRLAGHGTAVWCSGTTYLQVTRHGPDGTVATARVEMDVRCDGDGILPPDVLGRIVKVKGPLTVTANGGGLAFTTVDGAYLGCTGPAGDAETAPLQVVAWPHVALTSTRAVKVEADWGHHRPEVGRSALEALQGVADAAARGGDARAVLTAVALHPDGTAAATDTYRLHVADVPGAEVGPDAEPYADALVPADVLRAIPSPKVIGFRLGALPRGLADGLMGGWGMAVRLRYGTARNPVAVTVDATGPTVAGPYPDWRGLMPTGHAAGGTCTVSEGLADAVKAVQPKGPAYVSWDDGATAVTVQAMTSAVGSVAIVLPDGAASATVGTATTGTAAVILQGGFVGPALRFVGAGGTVEVREPSKAVALVGAGRRALVMPMRAGRS